MVSWFVFFMSKKNALLLFYRFGSFICVMAW